MATKNIKEIRLGKKIKEALDGRTQRWLAAKINMSEDKMSNKMKGITPFTPEEVQAINLILNTNY